MIPLFSSTAIKCIDLMFGHHAEVCGEWELVGRLNASFDHLVTMGTANEEYSALIFTGVSASSLSLILEEDVIDGQYLFDTLGEFVNSYCALLDDTEAFTDTFGKQIQAVPLLFSGGVPFMPFLQGIQGRLKVAGEYIYIGYVIRKNDSSFTTKVEFHGK